MFEVTMTAEQVATYPTPMMAFEAHRDELFKLLTDTKKEYITQTVNYQGGFKSTATERV